MTRQEARTVVLQSLSVLEDFASVLGGVRRAQPQVYEAYRILLGYRDEKTLRAAVKMSTRRGR